MTKDKEESIPPTRRVGVKRTLESLDAETRTRVFKFALREKDQVLKKHTGKLPTLVAFTTPGRRQGARQRARFISRKFRSATEGKAQTLFWTVGVSAAISGVTLAVGFGSAPFTAGLGTAAAAGIALGISAAGAAASKVATIALDPYLRKARNFALIYRRASKKAEMGSSMDPAPNQAIEEMVSFSLLKGEVAAIEYVVDHYLLAEAALGKQKVYQAALAQHHHLKAVNYQLTVLLSLKKTWECFAAFYQTNRATLESIEAWLIEALAEHPKTCKSSKKCAIEKRINDHKDASELATYLARIKKLEDFGIETVKPPESHDTLTIAKISKRESDCAEIYFQSRIEQVGEHFSDLLSELFSHLDERGAKRKNLAFTHTSINVTDPKLKQSIEKSWKNATCPNALERFQRKLGHVYSRRTKQEFLIEVMAESADALALPLKSAASLGLGALPVDGTSKIALKGIPSLMSGIVKLGFMVAKEQDNKGFRKGKEAHDLGRELKEIHRVVSTEYGLTEEDLLDFFPGIFKGPFSTESYFDTLASQKGEEYIKENHKGLSRDIGLSLKQAWDHLKLLDKEFKRTLEIFEIVQELHKDPSYLSKHGGIKHPGFELHLKSLAMDHGDAKNCRPLHVLAKQIHHLNNDYAKGLYYTTHSHVMVHKLTTKLKEQKDRAGLNFESAVATMQELYAAAHKED